MKAYSLDLRERVLKDVDDDMTCPAAARKYSVSPAWVRRLKQRRAATGEVGPRPQRRGPVPAWVTHAGPIREAVRRKPDATLDEHCRVLQLPLARATLARALLALGLTRKKSHSGRPSRTGRT